MTTRIVLLGVLLSGVLQAQEPLTTSAQRYFTSVRRNLEGSADAMPADKYGFRLTAGQMSFAEWLNHATQRNYSDCAILKGESVPAAGPRAANLKEKAEVSQALKDSFAYCADVLKTVGGREVASNGSLTLKNDTEPRA